MKELIREKVNKGEYSEAYSALVRSFSEEIPKMTADPDYCVLAADVFLNSGELDRAFDIITLGLLADRGNYELYLLLGEYYWLYSPNQALICYNQALFLCNDNDDREVIKSFIDNAVGEGASLRKVSVVIRDIAGEEDLNRSISWINRTIPADEAEIVVTDKSFNDGIKKAAPENDVFLLKSGTVLLDNSFFYILLGAYSSENIGAIGGLRNNTDELISEQGIDFAEYGTDDVFEVAGQINTPMKNALEKKIYLLEDSLFIRREALDSVGLFDISLNSSSPEDIDLCVRINLAGFDVVLAYNSFTFCPPRPDSNDPELEQRNNQVLRDKWNCNLGYSSDVRTKLIAMIRQDHNERIEVLELGCALGSTLNRIKYLWPNSEVFGVEYTEAVARIAGSVTNVIQGDVENVVIPYEREQFDYIICADVLEHLRSPEETIRRFLPCLKKNGYFIISLPNIRYYAVCAMLMQYGRFDYADSGILDRTHLRFFTRDTAIEMLESCGLEVVSVDRNYNETNENNDFIMKLTNCFDVSEPDELRVFQYYFLAKPR